MRRNRRRDRDRIDIAVAQDLLELRGAWNVRVAPCDRFESLGLEAA
jgi:hypothetical protein